MIKNPITKRRCRRCGSISHKPLIETEDLKNQGVHRLCDKCTRWAKINSTNPVRNN